MRPWTITARIGPAMEPGELLGARGDDGPLDPAHERVVAEVQRILSAS